jgi:hypothetical protein
MADYMTLLGAEDVRAAGSRIVSAAEAMRHAASTMEESLHRHQRFLDEWITRFETVVERLSADAGEK